jgi:TonB family protein
MRAALLLAAASVLGAATATAQSSPMLGAILQWRSLSMVIAPDSSGVYLWVSRERNESQTAQMFGGTFRPASVEAWLAPARQFLRQPLGAGDTGTVRTSPFLRGITGEALYLVKRRRDGAWSNERLLVMESSGDGEPMVISGTATTVGDILDSLAKVAPRAPFSEEVVQRRVSEIAEKPEKAPAANPDNRPPVYPQDLRAGNFEGLVLVRFTVGVDGKADMSTVVPIASAHRDFLRTVMATLPTLRFSPAEKGGEKVRSPVLMPFQFSLVR